MKPAGNAAESGLPLLNTKSVARLLGCSVRQVQRLHRTGQMPSPVRVGGLVRWSATTIRKWIESGCPSEPHRDKNLLEHDAEHCGVQLPTWICCESCGRSIPLVVNHPPLCLECWREQNLNECD